MSLLNKALFCENAGFRPQGTLWWGSVNFASGMTRSWGGASLRQEGEARATHPWVWGHVVKRDTAARQRSSSPTHGHAQACTQSLASCPDSTQGHRGPRAPGPRAVQQGPPVSSEATSIQGLCCRHRPQDSGPSEGTAPASLGCWFKRWEAPVGTGGPPSVLHPLNNACQLDIALLPSCPSGRASACRQLQVQASALGPCGASSPGYVPPPPESCVSSSGTRNACETGAMLVNPPSTCWDSRGACFLLEVTAQTGKDSPAH